jgi:hypothetical protein
MGKIVTVAYEKPRRSKPKEVVRAEVVSPAPSPMMQAHPTAPPGAIAGPFWLVGPHVSTISVSATVVEAHDSGFTHVTRNVQKFEAAMAKARAIGPLDSDQKVFEFVRSDFEKLDQEVFSVLGFDLNNDLRVYSEIARGQRDRVAVTPGDILRPVLIEGCVAYVVCHNHPSGNASPSEQDKSLTALLKKATWPYEPGLTFLDHLVIGSNGTYYSFADRKLKRG